MLLVPMLLPKTVPDTAEGTWAVQPHAKLGSVCNSLSSVSLSLHWLHVSSPKPAISLPPATFTKGQYLQGRQVDHFLEKLSKYLTWCVHGARVVHDLPY